MVTELRPLSQDAVFAALADPTRRSILDMLRAGERRAGDIASAFDVSRPAIAKHVGVLRRAGLVRERKVAQARIYALAPEALAPVEDWLAPYRVFWGARLYDLKSAVEASAKTPDENTLNRNTLNKDDGEAGE